ncbi:ShlB/FhaC/HecB family hemolysin secretion/activation protein [Methylosinus sp. Sm6]|uniref:ShlB/FhaC/HecB family hemolysin secretion/activation protein n=1 Tax=Methylosinus sp. Sm6 TaxID=2866948 RepID=UPI001C99A1DF|nr:ShlB/FhaC/HecB family hemolysin secretion/activation protein [Methylosinus sp. Sm6]MBY6239901.1 ShlB/FhaC/HecB family hemolysin secretion/activation protein [Methylosinus sp. Sm6]
MILSKDEAGGRECLRFRGEINCSAVAVLVMCGAVTAAAPAWSASAAKAGEGEARRAATTPVAADAEKPSGASSGEAGSGKAGSADAGSAKAGADKAASKPAPPARFDIDDFAVEGAERLTQVEVEEAIYPFVGPRKTADDVEKARAALEKAYHDRGFQTVGVSVPQQSVKGGVVVLKVAELKVGRLRVKNARYFDIDKIKEKAPSLKEGNVPNFGAVTKEIVALNQWPDRRVTPSLRAGVTPGTVDVDLTVDDKLPVHANVELNNRRSPNTSALRVVGTVRYDNLWQLGHSLSFTYQVAPERRSNAEVFSASYLARIPDVDWLSVLAYGLTSSSDVATVGGINVVGPGQTIGARAVMSLPAIENLYHSLSAGLDYKHYGEIVRLGGAEATSTPITYYPFVLTYGGAYQTEDFTSQLSASLTLNMRTASSDFSAFDNKRAYASGRFAHFNLEASHLQALPAGFQAYGRFVGQIADGPLVSSEQISVGGLDSVRGYLESEILGDTGAIGSFELRSPDVGEMLQDAIKREAAEGEPTVAIFDEWRLFGFVDKGAAEVLHPLAEQQAHFNLWSYGFGARVKLLDHVSGMFVYSTPMIRQVYTQAREPRLNFRVWGEF